MSPENVKILLTTLGGRVTESTKNWVTCSCIFAKWKHDGGVDKHPSSGVNLKEGEEPYYNCFTCKSHGTLDQVYTELKHFNKQRPKIDIDSKLVMSILSEEVDIELAFTLPDYETEIVKQPTELIPFSKSWYNMFPKAYKHPYLKTRDIDKKLAKQIDIRFDFKYQRILFPVYDWSGKLMGVHGRAIKADVDPRYYAYPKDGVFGGIRNPDVWMGEHHVDLDEPVILTEGQFDYSKVLLHYENTLAGLTTQMQETKLKRLFTACEIITIFDHGVGGDAGRDLISKTFKSIPVSHLYVPEQYGDLGNTPDELVYELLRYVD